MEAGDWSPDGTQQRASQTDSVQDLLAASIRVHAERIALIAPGRLDLSYADLGRQIEATRRALAGAGWRRGHRIAVALPHGPENAVAILAVMCATTCAPLNEEMAQDDVAHLLAAMRIDALIVPHGESSAASSAARRLGIEVIGLRGLAPGPAGMFELTPVTVSGRRAAEPSASGEIGQQIALLIPTGGTTGRPKVVPVEHWRLAWSVRRRVELARVEASDRGLFVMPFRSMAALRRGLLPSLVQGAAVICAPSHDSVTLVDLLESARPTVLMGPPVALLAMLDEIERRSPRPRHSLKYVASSFTSLSPAASLRIERVLGVPVTVVYGATEAGQIAQSPIPPDTAPAGSVGKPCLHEVAIWDGAGNPLPAGEAGEIVVRGPEVFAGYEDNDAANRAVFRAGWYRTGDMGHVDREGFIFLCERMSEVINRGGNKIVPSDVEAVLRQHSSVADAAAFGVPHATLGQDVAVAILPSNPALRESDLRRFVRSRLSPYKLPARYLILPELPRTALGKIDRLQLRDVYARAQTLAFEAPHEGMETEVARIFAEVLGVSSVSRGDRFFDLGGDSLRALSVLVEVESALGVTPGLETLFDHPSVASFAAILEDLTRDGAPIDLAEEA